MNECEQRKHFLKDGHQVEGWTVVPVCVRVHKQKVDHGPRDHVENRSRRHAEQCKGGYYFKGTHTLLTEPVQ